MRKFLVAVAIAALPFSMAHAANAQQQVMKSCNASATGKKGDERKAFMKSCLSDGRKAQQEKMKTCNLDAAGKKGAERRAFMSTCLSKTN